MDDMKPGTRLDRPVWFQPLLDPSWILPAERAGAQRICFVADMDPAADRALSLGLPLYLAESIRMTTDAITSSFTRGFEPASDAATVGQDWLGITRVEAAGGLASVSVRIQDPSGALRAEVARPGLAGAALGATLAELPRLLAAELRPLGVSGVWAPMYVPPSAEHGLSAVLGQHLVLSLRAPGTHPGPDSPPDERLTQRSAVKSALTALGDLAARSSQLFPALLFFGGVAATRAAKNDVFQDLRSTVAGVTMRATDPVDPLNRMSIFLFRLYGEQGTADSREKSAMSSGDENLKQWLLKVRALRWEK
jgi:hypothetical protein